MQIIGLSQKVSIYIGESDKWQGKPLYMAILQMLRQEDCAGATVTRAIAGFGAHSRIRTTNLVALSADLPLVITWVDDTARVERMMPQLKKMVIEGLIIVEEVDVIAYSHRGLRKLPRNIPVSDVMSHHVHTVTPQTPLVEALNLLLDKVYRALPVVTAEGQVVGMLTEGDLLNKAQLLSTTVQQQLTQAELHAQFEHLQGKTVQDLMTPHPVTINRETTIVEALKLMTRHKIKRLPVLNAEEMLCGMLSRVDLLRAFSYAGMQAPPPETLPPGQYRHVEEVMTRNVPTVQVDTSLNKVVNLLINNARRRVVVIDSARRVVGIITDGDLLSRVNTAEREGILHALSRRLPLGSGDDLHLSQRTAAEVMTRPVISVTPEMPLLEALQKLLTQRIKRLPVVDVRGQLVGLIGRRSILQALGEG